MKFNLLCITILISIIILSCCPEPKELTSDEVAKEKAAVIQVVSAYNKASEEKNFSAIVETLGNEVIFFGTDSSEIIKTISDFKKKINEQWQVYDMMKYGEPSDVSIHMDNQASFASIIFGVPCELIKQGQSERLYLRVARTLKKERGKWLIVSGIMSVARPDIETQNGGDTTSASTSTASQ